MSRVLVTGMSGVGKSTLLEGLARRGYTVLDTDYDGWVLADGRWDEARMSDLLDCVTSIVVSGTVENQAKFYDRFDHIVLLSAPIETLTARLMTRTSNPYGSRPEEQREIAHYVETVEPLLRQGAGVELDGRAEPASLVDAVETLIAASEGSRPGATTRRCNAQSFAGWCESNTGPLQTIDSTAAWSTTHYAAVVTGPVFEFSEVFNEDYLYFYGPDLEGASDAQAETVWRLLDLQPGMDVLDLACGHGRIANRLAQRGARVTGLDATPLFLEHARRDAAMRGIEVDYVSGDMRSLPWPEHRFERVISWFTSFGYFDDTDNQKVLSEAHRVLRPDGLLLVENNNLAELLPRWLPAVVVERDGDFMIDRSTFEPATGRAVTKRTCVRDGQVRRFTFSVRMFIGVELKDWLLAAGFDSVDQLDHEGAALTAGSGRMVSVAHKASGADKLRTKSRPIT